ncbi:MAG: hypothetical protein RJA70_3380 [Pseudomonadota bacterium]|jgi:penicillin-binding protein 1A
MYGALAPPNDNPESKSTLPRRASRRVIATSTPRPAEVQLAHADTHRDLSDETPAFDARVVSKKPAPKGRFWKKLFATLGILVGLGGLALTGTVYFLVEKYSEGLPSVQKLKAGYDPPQITRVYARDQSLLASLFTERRTVVKMEQIADVAKLSFLAAEDASFYEHAGLNYLGIARAMVANLRAGHTVQGGSTITQQVVKNILLDSERSLARKVREVLLAGRLERSLTKDEIFWLYLNHIYLGHGRYGIEEAARYYFGKHASELALDEATILAGLIAAPERFSPRRDPEKALQRRAYVLKQMLEKRFVTDELYQRVLKLPLRLAPAAEHESALVPEVVAIARTTLKQIAPREAASGGFELHTTIDPEVQASARAAVRQGLDDYMARHKLAAPYLAKKSDLWAEPFVGTPRQYRIYTGVVAQVDDHTGTIDVRVGDTIGRVALSTETRYNPKALVPSEFTQPGALLRVGLVESPGEVDGEKTKPQLRLELGPQASLIALDVRTREVLAVVGNYEALAGGLDRATRTRRQPGSTFKPIVYSYALHSQSFTPATPVAVSKRGHGIAVDAPLQLPVRAALAHSNNEVAVELFRHSGAEHVVQWARALGIKSLLKPDLSLALGSYELTLLELANAYVPFANGGLSGEPVFISKVMGPQGQQLPLPPLPDPRPVLTEAEAYLTTSLMRSVVETGTGRAARSLGLEVAGKTGTTNDAKDAWFVGFSTDVVAGVWVGYDDARSLGPRESGAKAALPIWIQFMKEVHERRPKTRFSRPSAVLLVDVDPTTGLLPRPEQLERITEEFLPGTEPTEVAPLADVAAEPRTEEAPPSGEEAEAEARRSARLAEESAADESAGEGSPIEEAPIDAPSDSPTANIPPPPPF